MAEDGTVSWRELWAETTDRLEGAGIVAASLEARWIVEQASGLEGPELVPSLDEPATVRGVDRTGAPIEVTGTGFFARCLQHEYDHLKGMLFIDHLPRNRRRRVLRDMEPYDWNAPVPPSP